MYMQKNYFGFGIKHCTWYIVHCTLILALGFGVAACSDDDDDDNNNENVESGQTVMPADANDDATVLRQLLQQWTDVEAETLDGNILSKTFEPVVGEPVSDDKPFVRAMVAGTVEEADKVAASMLAALGIDPQKPDGFTWKNQAIGTVSYSHGNGNELGVITVSVKQMPHLEKILLMKDADANWGSYDPYYSKGDIVRHKKSGRYYICVSDHKGGNSANWISFDCGGQASTLKTNTCSWSGVGDDVYYEYNDQATADNVAVWLEDFVLKDKGYEEVRSHIQTLLPSAANQIVPSSPELRNAFLDGIDAGMGDYLLEGNGLVGNERVPRTLNVTINGAFTTQGDDDGDVDYYDNDDDDITRIAAHVPYEIFKNTKSTLKQKTYPVSMLLAGPMRWSMGFAFDYWVPYLVICETSYVGDFEDMIWSLESQTILSPSHFKWKKYTENYVSSGDSHYYIYLVALHWTHDPYERDGKNYYQVFDFTKDKRQLKGENVGYLEEADYDWSQHNITSHQLVVKDKGVANSDFDTVYRGEKKK